MDRDNGGQAFPNEQDYLKDGMTLLDYFAIRANEKDIEEFRVFENTTCGDGRLRKFPKYSRVSARYLFADAMLLERNKCQ